MKKKLVSLLALSFFSMGITFAQYPFQGQGPVIPNPSVPQTPPPMPGSQTPPPPNPQTPPGWSVPGYLTIPPSEEWMNQGNMNVMATGYNSEGVLIQIPLYVSYNFNGANYNVMVLNSWNPYTQTWNTNVDIPASSTDYYLNGFTYNFFATLPIGNFYFNL